MQQKPKSNAGIWVVLLVLAVAGVGAFVLLSGDDEKGGGSGGGGAADDASSPEAVIDAYEAALAARDCTAMSNLSSAATLDASGGLEASVTQCEEDLASGEAQPIDLTVEDTEVVSETDDSAIVAVTATAGGETETTEFPLVKEGGQWKIDFYNMGSGASMDTEAPPAASP